MQTNKRTGWLFYDIVNGFIQGFLSMMRCLIVGGVAFMIAYLIFCIEEKAFIQVPSFKDKDFWNLLVKEYNKVVQEESK